MKVEFKRGSATDVMSLAFKSAFDGEACCLSDVWQARFSVGAEGFSQCGDWFLFLNAENHWMIETSPFPTAISDRILAVKLVNKAWKEHLARLILADA